MAVGGRGLAIVLCFEKGECMVPRTAAYAICLDVALRNQAVRTSLPNRRVCFEFIACAGYGYMPIAAKSTQPIRKVSSGDYRTMFTNVMLPISQRT